MPYSGGIDKFYGSLRLSVKERKKEILEQRGASVKKNKFLQSLT